MGFVAIVSVASLAMLGNWASGLLGGAIQTGQTTPMDGNQSMSDSSLSSFAGLPGDVAGTRGGSDSESNRLRGRAYTGTLPPPKTYEVTLGDGRTLRVSLSDPAQIAETAGGSGITHNALAALDNIILQLEQQSEGTDPAIGPLRELAERGRKIRDVQAMIESQFPPEGFKTTSEKIEFMRANYINLNGNRISLLAAANQLNFEGYYAGTMGLRVTPSSRNTPSTGSGKRGLITRADQARNVYELFLDNRTVALTDADGLDSQKSLYLRDFMTQYYTVKDQGILDDPVMNQLITDVLGRQIFMSSLSTREVATQAELKNLVTVTGAGAKGICNLSNTRNCPT
jgi:hypothetical protein